MRNRAGSDGRGGLQLDPGPAPGSGPAPAPGQPARPAALPPGLRAVARGLRHGGATAAAGGSAFRVVWRRWAPSAEMRLGRQGGAEVGRGEVRRGGRRRGKRAWVAGAERRSREVAEPPDGPALKEEIATPFLTKFGQATLDIPFSRRGRKSKMAWENFCFLETFRM